MWNAAASLKHETIGIIQYDRRCHDANARGRHKCRFAQGEYCSLRRDERTRTGSGTQMRWQLKLQHFSTVRVGDLERKKLAETNGAALYNYWCRWTWRNRTEADRSLCSTKQVSPEWRWTDRLEVEHSGRQRSFGLDPGEDRWSLHSPEPFFHSLSFHLCCFLVLRRLVLSLPLPVCHDSRSNRPWLDHDVLFSDVQNKIEVIKSNIIPDLPQCQFQRCAGMSAKLHDTTSQSVEVAFYEIFFGSLEAIQRCDFRELGEKGTGDQAHN